MRRPLKKFISAGIVIVLLFGGMMAVYGSAVPAPEKKVNINTASLAELQTLPRIGEAVAQRIVDFRSKNGKFNKIEEIMKVKGIGEKIFKQIRDRITVEGEGG